MIINNELPVKDDLKDIVEKFNKEHTYTNTYYRIKVEDIADQFIWLVASHGKSAPHGEEVIDTINNTIINNPKQPHHAELNNQFFLLYDKNHSRLYISSNQKKSFVEDYFSSILSKDVILKQYIVSVQEFSNRVQSISSIKLVSKNNLFSEQNDIMQDVKNTFGLGTPANYLLEVNFNKVNKTDKFKDFLNKVLNWRNGSEIDSLICVGNDDQDLQILFNLDTISEKIDISLVKNDNGLYNAEEVKKLILSKVGKHDSNLQKR